MTAKDFQTAFTNLMLGAKDLHDWGIEGGHLDANKLRLTIGARADQAKKLIEAGMSRRKAAKLLGVDDKTIRNDVRNNSAKGAEKVRASTRTNGNGKPAPNTEESREQKDKETDARIHFLARTEDACKLAIFDGSKADKDIIEAAELVVTTWETLIDKMEGM